jgi:hypothetical protein
MQKSKGSEKNTEMTRTIFCVGEKLTCVIREIWTSLVLFPVCLLPQKLIKR